MSATRTATAGRASPTDTETKLHDAEKQLDLGAAHADDEATVRSCINGMIDMGRSATFVMQKESGPHPALTEVYLGNLSRLI